MMTNILCFCAGCFVGSVVGMFTFSLCKIAGQHNQEVDHEEPDKTVC